MFTRAKNESVIGMYVFTFFQPPTNDQGKVCDKKSFGFDSFNVFIYREELLNWQDYVKSSFSFVQGIFSA